MLDRRQFLSAAAAGATLSLIGATRVAHDTASLHDLAHPALLDTLGADTVREIGESYRALVPAEHDRAALEHALQTELRAASSSNEDPVGADFAAGRTIVVRDWVLSRTEARQCALYSLRRA